MTRFDVASRNNPGALRRKRLSRRGFARQRSNLGWRKHCSQWVTMSNSDQAAGVPIQTPSHLDAAPEPPWRAALASEPIHNPPRILVAEDDAEMLRLVAEALRKDGYDVRTAADGGRLLVTLAHGFVDRGGMDFFDLLVTDMRMPVCTGIQILEQVRAVQWRVPVILMTAFGDEATRSQARTLGALLFDKPFDVDDLRTAVSSLLRRS
jgi:CheY-like chemotaxis protein